MISTFVWHKNKPFKADASRAEMFASLQEKDSLLWVDLESPSEFESDCLVEIFNFHPLAIEDCLVDHSHPKVDDYDEYLFLVMHALVMARNEEKKIEELATAELEIFFGKNFVVTFHKTPLKTVAAIRETVRRKPDLFMGHGSDLLAHALLDRLVDNYQPVLDLYDDKIDKLEEEIFNNPPPDFLAALMQAKQDVFTLKRIVSPQRDTINYLARTPTAFVRQKNMMYFRDIYDHLLRIYSVAEGFHENLSNILQAYFSCASHKLNEVVKHMTVLATLSMPALLIATLYGMNFSYIPGIGHPYAFWAALGGAASVSIIMLIFMKLKKWI